jgi:ribosomal protein L1
MGSGNSKGGKAKAVKAEKLAVMPELVRCVHVLGRGLGRRGAAATSLKT